MDAHTNSSMNTHGLGRAGNASQRNNRTGSYTTQNDLFVSTIDDSDELSFGDLRNSRTETSANKRPSTDIEPLAEIEDRAVSCLRIVVVTVLLLAGTIVGVIVYLVVAGSDIEDFERQYVTHASQILEAFNDNVNLKLGAAESLGVSVTSYASNQRTNGAAASDPSALFVEGEWPFVTVADFAAKANVMREMSDALFVAMCPIVAVDQLEQWEAYSRLMGNTWIPQSVAYEQLVLEQDQARNTENNDHSENRSPHGERMLTGSSVVPGGTTSHAQYLRHVSSVPTENVEQQQMLTNAVSGESRHRSKSAIAAAERDNQRTLEQLQTKPSSIAAAQLNMPNYSLGFAGSVFLLSTFNLTQDGSQVAFMPQKTWKDLDQPYYVPGWQHSEVVREAVNFDLYSYTEFRPPIVETVDSKQAVLSRITDLGFLGNGNPLEEAFIAAWEDDAGPQLGDPFSLMTFPILEDAMASPTDPNNRLVAVLVIVMYWTSFMSGILSADAKGITVVIENGCQQQYTYEVTGSDAVFVGVGDLHDVDFSDMEESIEVRSDRNGIMLNTDFCPYVIRVYPSQRTKDFYRTLAPVYYTVVCACVFVFSIVLFLLYDCVVERRQKLVLKTAVENRAIVSSLFPAAIRDRLFHENNADRRNGSTINTGGRSSATPGLASAMTLPAAGGAALPLDEAQAMLNRKTGSGVHSKRRSQPQDPQARMHEAGNGSSVYRNDDDNLPTGVNTQSNGGIKGSGNTIAPSAPVRLKNFLNGNDKQGPNVKSFDQRPIADIYPHTTVFFADIAGFTRWSSQREPTEVFELLQTLYAAFDRVAKRLKVFKIETIGDCYVAVTGLPDPQPDHAIVMARFARECVHRMYGLVRGLVSTLGEDTAELTLRVGIHSGPVTAGVLRGEKSRFQLFGDTVNTASRMESTGRPNHIQCSESTATLLKTDGKEAWLKARSEKVFAKGKGELQTFWIKNRSRPRNDSGAGNHSRPGIGDFSSVGSVESIGTHDVERSEHTIESGTAPVPTNLKKQTSMGETSVDSTGSSEGRQSPTRLPEVDSAEPAVPRSQPKQRSTDSVGSVTSASLSAASASDDASTEAAPPRPQRIPSTVSSITRRDRCVSWATDMLATLIKRVVLYRHNGNVPTHQRVYDSSVCEHERPQWEGSPCLVIDEVAEIIKLPRNDGKMRATTSQPTSNMDDLGKIDEMEELAESVDLGSHVMAQLDDYVSKIASMYRDNPFHCFEHACHVAMSTHKLMVQINEQQQDWRKRSRGANSLHGTRTNVTHEDVSDSYDPNSSMASITLSALAATIALPPSSQDANECGESNSSGRKNPLAYLDRITSNPLCHFALVFSAIVHDVDHTGISNMDLIRSSDEMAELYENRSVAEQNSMDIAWELLMDEAYADLQRCIYQTQQELDLFRQLTVNCVMATDIFDKEAKAFREKRWHWSFGSQRLQRQQQMSTARFEQLQATVVLEHAIQASDVIHTMQHFSVFRKWNERLFEEMLQAYEARLSLKDPTGGWFESEVMFFDFYVIPLARKLLESGAFGSSSDEFLQYALENRALWAVKGSDVVREMASKYHRRRILSTFIEADRLKLGNGDGGDEDDFTAGQSHASSRAA